MNCFVDFYISGENPKAAAPASPSPTAEMRQSVAWVAGATPANRAAADTASFPQDPPGAARGASGGIAFDVTLDAPTAAARGLRQTQKPSYGRRAAEPPPPPPPPTAPPATRGAVPEGAAATLTVPAQLFGAGTPLSSKVQKLRDHLVEQLGGKAHFERVYDYVAREESGAQQSGEREQILAFMAAQGQRELLPLVHTLLYLEEALGTK